MKKLWKKESKDPKAMFVDLFGNIGLKYTDNLNTKRQHHFFDVKCDVGKNSVNSNKFRKHGMKLFQNGDWSVAMDYFNYSLQLAVPGTDYVSYSYENRAICFMKMQDFEKCLKDIELAVKAKHPNIPKLMSLKENCQNLMEERGLIVSIVPFNPKLSFDASEQFPTMANVLEIKRNGEFGRHMVAKSDIDVGEVVITEDYFVSLAPGGRRVHCFECLLMQMNFIPCEKCSYAVFCSVDCMDRSTVHKVTCGLNINRIPHFEKYLAKSILIALSIFKRVKDLMYFVQKTLAERENYMPESLLDMRSRYALFLNLVSATQSQIDMKFVYKVYMALLDIPYVKEKFVTTKNQRFLTHLICQHLMIMSANTTSEDMSTPTTISSVSVLSSLINHSCVPNLFCCTKGDKEILIALRPIKKGEQLFLQYTSSDEPTRQRQLNLSKQWGFVCKCDKCVPRFKKVDRDRMKSDPCYIALHAIHMTHSLTSRNFLDALDQCEEFLRKYGDLPWSEEIDIVLKVYRYCLLAPFKEIISSKRK